jgi:FKBP-type peptidyl-prolyl cis-trans isomerase FklB
MSRPNAADESEGILYLGSRTREETIMKKVFRVAAVLCGLMLAGCAVSAADGPAVPAKAEVKAETTAPATAAAVAAPAATAEKPVETPKVDMDKVMYCIGVAEARNFKRQDLKVNVDQFCKGIKDGMDGKPVYSNDDMNNILADFQKEMTATMADRLKAIADKNKKEGDDFLADNKKKEGVITLPSGLQYKIIKEGTGELPKASDNVVCSYRGWLLDGAEFDSSYRRNDTPTIPVGGVIKGWSEALQLMKVGSEWRIFVPGDLAYGPAGRPPVISPNSVLCFDVKVISIAPPAPLPPGGGLPPAGMPPSGGNK